MAYHAHVPANSKHLNIRWSRTETDEMDVISDKGFPTMWHFDNCKLRRALM